MTKARSIKPKSNSNLKNKPCIIGIYGISGCGKSYLLNQLKSKLTQSSYNFYDGSQIISQVVPGGLAAFLRLSEAEKTHWRTKAGESIKTDCIQNNKIGIIAGHFMLWENDGVVRVVMDGDLEKYEKVLYLYTPISVLKERRDRDRLRVRPELSKRTLRYWQRCEKLEMKMACSEMGISFELVTFHPLKSHVERVISLINSG